MRPVHFTSAAPWSLIPRRANVDTFSVTGGTPSITRQGTSDASWKKRNDHLPHGSIACRSCPENRSHERV